MAAKQTPEQKQIVERVMHEFSQGELERKGGRKVRNPKQAIAIGLSEAGASNRQSAGENRRRLARTEAKQRQGDTSQAAREPDDTRAALYRQAQERKLPGRSRMSKADLRQALARG